MPTPPSGSCSSRWVRDNRTAASCHPARSRQYAVSHKGTPCKLQLHTPGTLLESYLRGCTQRSTPRQKRLAWYTTGTLLVW